MDSSSRIKKFGKNASFAAMSELAVSLLNFVVRIVFVRCLSIEYLGITGLFSNILTILSLAELGAGTAIVYSMYKPLAENDYEKIKSLINLFKKIYISIGTFILIVGLCFLPFLDVFIKERPHIPYFEFIVIYILSVISTSVTYFFSYQTSILGADQKNYIVHRATIISNICRVIVQILILVLLHNFIAYQIAAILATLLLNIYLVSQANRAYPFIKEKASPLDKATITEIKKNTFAMLLYKVGITIATSIETILLSKFFGLVVVGIYANYHLIFSYSNIFFSKVLGSVVPSLGNLMVTADEKKKMQVFATMQLIYYWLATYQAVTLILVFNPFIELFFGKQYLFSQGLVVALVVNITFTNYQRPCSLMRDAAGLFWYGKYRPLIMALLNFGLSILGLHFFGIVGVVMGTIAAKMLTYVWYDPYIVFKHALNGSLSRYYFTYLKQWGLMLILSVSSYCLYIVTNASGIYSLIISIIISTLIVNVSFYCLYKNSESMLYLKGIIIPITQKIFRK